MDFQPGDILRSKKTKHPIIFLDEIHVDSFCGCIITHASSSQYPENIKLARKHFLDSDLQGKAFSIQWDQTYFVDVKLEKKKDWGPFTRQGKLSDEGLKFLHDYLNNKKPKIWTDFLKEKRSST